MLELKELSLERHRNWRRRLTKQHNMSNIYCGVRMQHWTELERKDQDYEVADSSFRDPVFGSLGKIS